MKAPIRDGIVHSPFPNVDIPKRTFYEAAKSALLVNPSKIALGDDLQSITRAELLVRLQRYALGFQQNGVRPGDRVCVHISNSVENFVALCGCIVAGATVVLAKPSLTERELLYQISDSDSTHLLVEPGLAEKTLRAASTLKLKGLFATGQANGFVSTASFLELDEASFKEIPISDPRENVLSVIYTSGTTGLPKGVEITHYSFLANIELSRWTFCWDESDVVLLPTPITHGSGLLCITISVLRGTTCVILPPNASLEMMASAVDSYKATAAVILPSNLQTLVNDMTRTGRRLGTLRCICTGGSSITQPQYTAVRDAFGPSLKCFANTYGMTEALGILCSPSNSGAIGIDVGFPAPMTRIKIVDRVTRQRLGPHQTGEICFRTETIMRGYYKRPKETAEFFDEEGWGMSGDAGYYDEDGRIHFVQRFKEMLKCMDNQVVPTELETLLFREHSDDIIDVCVVGIPNPKYGEAPAAAVVLRHSAGEDHRDDFAQKIKATIAESCSFPKHLHGGVFFLDSLPKTESGKPNRAAVLQLCKERTAY